MAAAAVRLRRFEWTLELGTPLGARAAGTWRCAHEADPREALRHAHGRQHHQHLPGHDGLAPAAGAALPLHHPEAAGELERAAAAGFGVPAGQRLGLALALCKCQAMGLLPTHASDWLAFLVPPQCLELTGGGLIL